MEKPKVVVLCGSSRFTDIMAVCAWLIERDEKAITMGLHLLPEWYCQGEIPDHLAEHEGVASEMDTLHLRKIDLADEIFVVNFDDYIGTSTANEINYAFALGKKIRWFTHDEIGSKIEKLLLRYGGSQSIQRCRVCGCTDDDCSQCIEKNGEPCHWVAEDLCSACAKEEGE